MSQFAPKKKVYINGVMHMVSNRRELIALKSNIERSSEKLIERRMENGVPKTRIHINTDNIFNIKMAPGKPITKPKKPGVSYNHNEDMTIDDKVLQSKTISNRQEKIVRELATVAPIKSIMATGITRQPPKTRNLSSKPTNDPEEGSSKKLNIVQASKHRSIGKTPVKECLVNNHPQPQKEVTAYPSEDSVKKPSFIRASKQRSLAATPKITHQTESPAESPPPEEPIVDPFEELTRHMDPDDYFEQTFTITPNKWYSLALKMKNPNKNCVLKLLDGNQNQIFPLIKLPNILYSPKKTTPEDVRQVNDQRIYFKPKSKMVHVFALGTSFSFIKLSEVSLDTVNKNIDLWRFRKYYDLELTRYYLNTITHQASDQNTRKFADKFVADHELYTNRDFFDSFNPNVTLSDDDRIVTTDSPIAVLYLMHSSIEYETCGYTVWTHCMLKSTSESLKYKTYGGTMYGYPYNQNAAYYGSEPGESYVLNDVLYVKMLDGEDNMYTNNLINFLSKYIVATIKLAHRLDAKIIHASTNCWNGVAAAYAAKFLGIKSIYEIRGFWDEGIISTRPELQDTDYLRMMINLETKVLQEVDHVVIATASFNDRLLDFQVPDDKITVIHNGVDINTFQPQPATRKCMRNKLAVTDDDIVIGYIGIIAECEGLDHVLECLRNLNSHKLSVKLVLVGDGTHREKLLETASAMHVDRYVIYVGTVEYTIVADYYNVFDLVVYPRKYGSSGSGKILEAMATGLPVVASRLKPWDDILEDGKTGLFCEPDNVLNLENTISHLIEDKTLRHSLGHNARKWVTQNRNWSIIGQQVCGLYDTLLQEHPPLDKLKANT